MRADVQGWPGTVVESPRIVLHNAASCLVYWKMSLQVWAISTEDMDALTFGTPRLVRNMMAAVSQHLPINEYEYDKARLLRSPPVSTCICCRSAIGSLLICAQVIEGLGLTQEQFIDMCILCGCDYCGSIKG